MPPLRELQKPTRGRPWGQGFTGPVDRALRDMHAAWEFISEDAEQACHTVWVTCNWTIGTLTALFIQYKGRLPFIPSSIFELPHLEVLDCTGTTFVAPIPKTINSTRLRSITLGIIGSLPTLNIPSLRTINFTGTISGSLPDQWGTLDNVETITIISTSNWLQGPIPRSWCNLRRLQTLTIHAPGISTGDATLPNWECFQRNHDIQLWPQPQPVVHLVFESAASERPTHVDENRTGFRITFFEYEWLRNPMLCHLAFVFGVPLCYVVYISTLSLLVAAGGRHLCGWCAAALRWRSVDDGIQALRRSPAIALLLVYGFSLAATIHLWRLAPLWIGVWMSILPTKQGRSPDSFQWSFPLRLVCGCTYMVFLAFVMSLNLQSNTSLDVAFPTILGIYPFIFMRLLYHMGIFCSFRPGAADMTISRIALIRQFMCALLAGSLAFVPDINCGTLAIAGIRSDCVEIAKFAGYCGLIFLSPWFISTWYFAATALRSEPLLRAFWQFECSSYTIILTWSRCTNQSIMCGITVAALGEITASTMCIGNKRPMLTYGYAYSLPIATLSRQLLPAHTTTTACTFILTVVLAASLTVPFFPHVFLGCVFASIAAPFIVVGCGAVIDSSATVTGLATIDRHSLAMEVTTF